MFFAFLRRVSALSNKSWGFVLLGGIFLGIFLSWQYQTGIRVGDGAIKQQQIADLIRKGFPDFSCSYAGSEIDPNFLFLPLDMKRGATMAHIFQGKCYYVFPFYYSSIQLPFALFFGRFGSFLLSFLFGLGTLYVSFLLSVRLGFKERTRAGFLAFLLLGSAFSLFSTDLSETILSIFGVTLGAYFLLREEDPEISSLVLAGISFGFASLFRQEVILLAGSIAIFQVPEFLKRPKLTAFSFSFGLLLLGQMVLNGVVVGHPLGSRGYLQASGTENFDLAQQFQYLGELLVYGKGSYGLFGAYPFLLVLFRWKKEPSSITRILFSCVLFILVSALLTSSRFWQGVMFGPRFLMTILPLSLLFGFHILEKHWDSDPKWLRAILLLALAYSVFGALRFDLLYRKFTRSVIGEQVALSAFCEKTVVYRKDSVFLPPDSFDKQRDVYELYEEKDFDSLLETLEKGRIGRITVVGFKDRYPKEVLVPNSEKFKFVNRNFLQSQSINMETLEFERIR
ncbi:hypothetical protein EHQ61_16955 [Leptospira wolffii]|uniref:ArnT family glycosyltransferase n=1 Tax=Leptospira wolffii TaxID=409998 RepID=UPI001083CA9E|nr:glycosyltransferase family 39 protein [Leptospira wolffii]TGL46439.1 hypothetical protein EHQ61_16955 [Leptospira wolffii]